MAKSKKHNLLVWIVLGVLVIGMFGFGATGLRGRIKTVGNVGDVPVTVTAYANELQGQINAASNTFGTALSFAQAETLGIPQRAQAVLITQRVLDNEMVQLGISAGDEEVRKEVLATPAFRGSDGSFDRDRYAEILRQNNLTEAEYETSIREGAARALLQGAVLTGLPEPTLYAQTLATYIGERRSFTWGSISELAEPLPEPTEGDLQAYYDANPDAFTSPETKVLTYVWLSPDMIQDEVTVDEDELRASYEERIDEFVQPERRLVERLVFSDAEAAQAAMDAIAAGDTDFDTLVTDRGLDLSDVDLGDMTERDLGAAGADVFAATPGDVVGPFDSNLGPALFRMNAILSGLDTSFEEAIPDLREDLAAARARRVIQDQIDPITDLLAGGARLEDVAERTDMQLDSMDWTDASEDGIAAYAEFREAVSELEPGTYPELTELEDGGLFAVRVDEIRAPALRPLDEVRAEVIAGWQTSETTARLLAQAEDLADSITSETEFTELGIADAIAETDMTRRDFLNGTPPEFMTTVFALAEPGETTVLDAGDAVLIVRLDSVAPPPEGDAAVEAETAAISQNAGEGMARDVLTYFGNALQQQTDIQIDQQAINAVHTNFR